jgi:flagellar assembly protein FliH
MSAGTLQTFTPQTHTSAPRLQGSILVVDDDESIRGLFLELFRGQGVAIRLAGSAQEALLFMKQATPALLLVDVSLPDRDGITLLEEAQQLDNRILSVVMTGAPSVELAVRAMKAGATDFLMKPLQNDVVLTMARRLLELHYLRSDNTVWKDAAVRAGAVRVQSLPLQTFGEDGTLCGQDGLTEFERGLAEGERRADERRRHEQNVLAQAVRRLDDTRSLLQQTMEEDVVALSFHIASKVLREAADKSKDLIIAQARSALAAMKESGAVVLQVHPADVTTLEAVRAELTLRGDVAVTLHICAVPTVPRGTCLAHTTNRLIDASLDTQLLRLGEALKQRTRRESR